MALTQHRWRSVAENGIMCSWVAVERFNTIFNHTLFSHSFTNTDPAPVVGCFRMSTLEVTFLFFLCRFAKQHHQSVGLFLSPTNNPYLAMWRVKNREYQCPIIFSKAELYGWLVPVLSQNSRNCVGVVNGVSLRIILTRTVSFFDSFQTLQDTGTRQSVVWCHRYGGKIFGCPA